MIEAVMFWNEPSALGIVVSVVIACVAALNLFLDYEFIRQASVGGSPKYMEWYGAFGIIVTLVWLYLELLRLLAHLLLDRAGWRRQLDREGDVATADLQVADEPEGDDVTVEVRVLHGPQRIENGNVGGCGERGGD